MGFKRTSEGRVFFQGAEEASAPPASSSGASGAKKVTDYRTIAQTGAPQATQFQILTLLKVLNEKLKDGQTERNKMRAELDQYRRLITDLEGKTERGERAEKLAEETAQELQETRKLLLELEDKTEKTDKGFSTLQKQVGLTRAIGDEIIKKQTGFDELVKRLDVAETKQDSLTQKVDQTASQQSKMLRQIEKVAEDRTRFMRKIERIEETVIQTRDALNAKAMVLLTQQGAAAHLDAATVAPGPSVVEQVLAAGQKAVPSAWRRTGLQVAGMAALVTVAIFSGWLVSEIQKQITAPQDIKVSAANTAPAPAPNETAIAPPELATPAPAAAPDQATDQTSDSANDNTAVTEQTGPTDMEQAQPAPEQAQKPAAPTSDDVGTVDLKDENKVAAMLESNPDALAAALNKIEPGTAASAQPASLQPQEKSTEPASIKQAQKVSDIKIVETKTAQKPAEEKSAEVKASPKLSEKELRGMIRPDSSLPDSAKEIEAQAFAGVPEAQHDLAAVYTAGQGGVKQDYTRAAFWFRQAANQGIANARYNLGVLYHQGLGVKQDIKEAIKWYSGAAELGHPEAQYNLGIAYIEGVGVDYNPAKAATNFKSAAQHGITEAAYNLGLIYENGLLGEAKPAEALKWYKTAADQGSPEAKEALEQLAKTLDVKVEDVNRVADGAKSGEKQKPAAQEAPAQLAEASPATGPDKQVLTAQVQEYLMKAGLYPGPADGVDSALTTDAIRSYQSANGLKGDGKVSQDLLSYMLSSEKPQPSEARSESRSNVRVNQ